jgi:hypothetical protein
MTDSAIEAAACGASQASQHVAGVGVVKSQGHMTGGVSELDFVCRIKRCVTFSIAAIIMAGATADAQDAEPRLYSNTPVGLNFLIAGYVYSQGKLAFDPSLSIADAQFHANTGAVAYVRSFELMGQSAKFDVIVPYSGFSAHGEVRGQLREREISGLGDPRFRVSVNLLGAPALSLKEFANYRQDLIVGASLQVSAPLGQYDETKLLNLGGNRWSFRPELGISKAWGPSTLEVAPSVTFFTDNPDFFNSKTFAQAPLYLVRGHVIHFERRMGFAGRHLHQRRSHHRERRRR